MEFDVSHQDTVDGSGVRVPLIVGGLGAVMAGVWFLALAVASVALPGTGMTGYAAFAIVMQWILPPITALVLRKMRMWRVLDGTEALIVGAVLVAVTGCAATAPGVMQLALRLPLGVAILGLLLGGSGFMLWSPVVQAGESGESARWMGKVVALVLAGLPGTFVGFLYFVLPHAISQFPFPAIASALRLQDQERAGALLAFGGKGAIFLAFSIMFLQWSRTNAVVMEHRDMPGDDTDDGMGGSGPDPARPPDATLPAVLIVVTRKEATAGSVGREDVEIHLE